MAPKKKNGKKKTHKVFHFLNQTEGRGLLKKNKMRAEKNVLAINSAMSKDLKNQGMPNAKDAGLNILGGAIEIAKRAKRKTVTLEDLATARTIYGRGATDLIHATKKV